MTTLLLILFAAALLLSAPSMADLTAVLIRPRRNPDLHSIITLPANGALFAGALVELTSGKLQNATAAGTTFVGMALQSATAVNDRVDVLMQGEVRLSIAKGSALALSDVGSTVYVGDGGTDINLTASSRQAIGKITEVETASVGVNTGFCWVHLEGNPKRSI